MSAESRLRFCAEQGIDQGVQQHIRVAIPTRRLAVRPRPAAKPQRPAGLKPVRIVTNSDAVCCSAQRAVPSEKPMEAMPGIIEEGQRTNNA